MTRFVGGPYDGCEFPVAPGMIEVRLPEPEEMGEYDPQATSNIEWPHVYRRVVSGRLFRYTAGETEQLVLASKGRGNG